VLRELSSVFPMKAGELIKESTYSRKKNTRYVAVFPNELRYWVNRDRFHRFPQEPSAVVALPPGTVITAKREGVTDSGETRA
jgi:hypothetical protein